MHTTDFSNALQNGFKGISRRIPRAALILAIALGCVYGSTAQAGIIPASTSGGVISISGGGTGSVNGPFTFHSNNDGATIAENFAAVSKIFTSLNPIDIVLKVDPSDGITEYLFAEGIANLTGVTWTDYHIELGFGTGANFQLADPSLFLAFDNSPAADSFEFSTVTPDPNVGQVLKYEGGVVLPNSNLSLNFTIDVPDLISRQIPQFTIRQYPSVPEPSSIVMIGLGAVGMLLVARRRGR